VRERHNRDLKAHLIEEIWQNWKSRRLAVVHRLRTALAGTGKGPKKRSFFAPGRGSLTASEWEAAFARPGPAGGMSCEKLGSYEELHSSSSSMA